MLIKWLMRREGLHISVPERVAKYPPRH